MSLQLEWGFIQPLQGASTPAGTLSGFQLGSSSEISLFDDVDRHSISSASVADSNHPDPLSGPMAWYGKDLKHTDYIVHLTSSELLQIRAAVIHFKLLKLDCSQINKTTFPLPAELSAKLAGVSVQIHNGIGIVVIRGIKAQSYNAEESVIAFTGVTAHICPDRATDYKAYMTLTHIRDASRDPVLKSAEGIGLAASKLPEALKFHADRFSGDVLSLYVADSGNIPGQGEQYFASSWTVYNELLKTAPEVVETLQRDDWPWEVKDREGVPHLHLGPAMYRTPDGKIILQLVHAPLKGNTRIPRSAHMPPLSKSQEYALQAVEETARRVSMTLDHQRGDIQLFHNLSLMHARSAYEGGDNKRNTRHLLRLFLRDPEQCWEKPEKYADLFNNTFDNDLPQTFPIIDDDPWRKTSGSFSHG